MACSSIEFPESAIIVKYKIKPGSVINHGTILCEYRLQNESKLHKFKSNCNGTVKDLLIQEGEKIEAGGSLLSVEACRHLTVWRNMCAECGHDLREEKNQQASVAMEHMIPDLLISENRAQVLGHADEVRLLKNRQLVLLVDLDQTLIHTTNDAIPPNLKDVYHFQLWPHPTWYHTKFRPHLKRFLEHISRLYELHICTFGTRTYAHTIARYLDPDRRYFSQRILSRDECFHPTLKTSNLKALFPCGDSMVCIIDDREDVWKMASNLVHVRPYRFFVGTADINAPPEASKAGVEPAVDELNGSITKNVRHTAKVVKVPKKNSTKCQQAAGEQRDAVAESSSPGSSADYRGEETPQGDEQNVKCADAEAEGIKGDTVVNEGSVTAAGDEVTGVNVVKDTDAAAAATVSQEPSSDVTGVEATDEKPQQASEETKTENVTSENVTSSDSAQVSTSDASTAEDKDTNANRQTSADAGDEEYEEMIEWEDSDDYLLDLEEILTRIHTVYYKFYDEMQQSTESRTEKAEIPDLKNIVPYVRRKVLKGAYIVFSGVCPLDTDPTKSRIYRMAESLGAVVQPSVVLPGTGDDSTATTHLIAARLGTQKLKSAARCKSIRIVNPDWLWTCADRWEWIDERLFPLDEVTSQRFLSRDSPDPVVAGRRAKLAPGGTMTSGLDNVTRDAGDLNAADQETEGSDNADVRSDNPLLAFSKEDICGMDAEVEELLEEANSDDDNDTDGDGREGGLESESQNERVDDAAEDRTTTEDDDALRKRVLSNYGAKRRKLDESSDEESLSEDFPKGWKPSDSKRSKRSRSIGDEDDEEINDDEGNVCGNEDKSSSDESGSSLSRSGDGDSIGSVDDEIAAAVEREFLS